MKIKQIGYRRVFNLGNYETETIELVAEVNDNEKVKEVLDDLKEETIAWMKYSRS